MTVADYYARVAPPLVDALGAVPVVDVANGTTFALSTEALVERVRAGGVAFESALDVPGRPGYATFARFAIRAAGAGEAGIATLGALALRAQLASRGLAAALASDGVAGYLAYVPLGDAPSHADLAARLATFLAAFVAQHPGLIAAPGDPSTQRAIVAALVREPSALPYSLRMPSRSVVVPLPWRELATFEHGSVAADDVAARLHALGDVFAASVAPLRAQASTAFA